MNTPLGRAVDHARKAKTAMERAFAELAALADQTENPLHRGQLNALLWECAAGRHSRDSYFSQYGQDAYIDTHVFGGMRDGVFVEIGGFDGVTGSNCLFFEVFRNWSGLFVEAVEEQFEKAAEFRRAKCVNALVGDGAPTEFMIIDSGPLQMSGRTASYDPKKLAWVEAQPMVSRRTETRPTKRLETLMRDHGIARADLVSIDIEGGVTDLLRDFPFEEIDVTCWLVEADADRDALVKLFEAQGYDWVDRIGEDELFAKV